MNLARLLFTLQYLDDSLFLARRSLELQAPDRNAWAQHYALGEILKAYGHHNEAVLHFRVRHIIYTLRYLLNFSIIFLLHLQQTLEFRPGKNGLLITSN